MEERTPVRSGTKLLLIMILVLTVLLIVISLVSRIVTREPEPTAAPATAPTVPTEPPPTEPPADPNPYGASDFQYEGDYLKLVSGESITGIDVSVYQGEIDWAQVKHSGVEFVMIRLGYRGYSTGAIVEDENFRTNLEGAAAAGLDVGVYFFSQAISVEEALEEAEFVLNALDGAELTMPVVYDWEYIKEEARTGNMDRRTLTDCSLAFLETIEKAGYWPMLYFNTAQQRNLLYLQELNQYDFWLALYSDRMTYPYKIKMWQYTCTGTVPGIEGNCDINIFFPDT